MRVLPRHQMTSGVLHDFLSAIRGAARNDRRRVQHTFFGRGMTTQELLMEGILINNRESDYRRGRRRMLFGGRRRWRCLCGGEIVGVVVERSRANGDVSSVECNIVQHWVC
jgi:hypothetical protein